ncbi:class I SAM-dependent RNA methyltransferase [Gemmobacter serpentinus]|uniref:class I SAM-dependent RNA methyltransferase n=1 Tax=Gemmobacter serpentinus TaxID=2652247 RepID=UPI00124EBD36|nr:class I SAM-dependent RNA methyltransferase [Gemmobacter serpentinus]
MKLTIARLGHHGDGIAEGPEGTIFVPGMLPGEEVEGELSGNVLTGVKIVTPSADRVKPVCSHAKTCGGCQMQHARDGLVADWKQGIAAGALAGQGLEAPLRPILTSPPRSRRRATLAARRTKGGTLIGFHARGSDTIIPVPNCQLLHPDLMAAMPALEALVMAGGSRSGTLDLTVTRSLAGPDVVVKGGKPLDADMHLQLARIAEAHGLSRLTWEDEVVALRAAPMQRFGRALVAPPPGAFLQATAEGEAALLATVREAVGKASRITDLFAGSGTFSLPLAEQADIHAVEGDAAMMTALDKGWRMAGGLHKVTVETRDLFRRPLEPDEFKGVEAVVIDPPRAGAEAQTATLARSKVPVIVMVSCNPVSFARDARVLTAAGYKLDWVQVVDQFRWSPHVELVARFAL